MYTKIIIINYYGFSGQDKGSSSIDGGSGGRDRCCGNAVKCSGGDYVTKPGTYSQSIVMPKTEKENRKNTTVIF